MTNALGTGPYMFKIGGVQLTPLMSSLLISSLFLLLVLREVRPTFTSRTRLAGCL